MPADNSAAVDELFKRGKRGGNRPTGRRPGLTGPKTPPAGQSSPENAGDQAEDKPLVPVDEPPANPPLPPEPPAAEVVDEPPPVEPPTAPEPEPPVKPSVPAAEKQAPDQRKRKAKRPSAPPVPEHRVNWNPEARQIRAELLGWCAARAKTAKRAADVARVLRKTYGDVPEDDLRAIVEEVAQRTGQPVEDVATVAGFAVD